MAQQILVDGSALLYRAWHSMPDLRAPDGRPSGAVRGYINMLDALAAAYPDAETVLVFDAPGPTFRHELYAPYKAQRKPMPDDLRSQIDWIHRLTRARGIPVLLLRGWEADDIIGTLARKGVEDGKEVLIYSQDKDLTQCVGEGVLLLKSLSEKPLDAAGVEKQQGVGPELVADLLALTGDTVDNIPGVKGIGPRTGRQLLKRYGSLLKLIEEAPHMPGSQGDKLRAALDDLPLFLDLVTISRDVPLEQLPLDQPADDKELATLYAELGFAEHSQQDDADWLSWPRAVDMLDTPAACVAWLQQAQLPVSLYFSTADPAELHGVPVVLGLADAEGRRGFLEFGEQQADLSPLQGWLQQLSAASDLILADAKLHHLRARKLGLRLPERVDDPLLCSYVLNPSAVKHEMEPVARFLGIGLRSFEDVAGKGAKQKRLTELAPEHTAGLVADWAEAGVKMQAIFAKQLQEAVPEQMRLYQELEIPVSMVLADMEEAGIYVDCAELQAQSKEINGQLETLREQVFERAGSEFNLDSPKQLGVVLFEKLNLPVQGRTKSGAPSTAESVLEQLDVLGHEIPRLILEYRSLHKLYSTYTLKLPKEVDAATGRVHTSYHQRVAATGRLSSASPNLQNIPIRTAQGRKVRKAFKAVAGCQLVAADYSQIEMRVMAHIAADPNLVAAFIRGEDVHRATAQELFGSAEPEYRRRAKAVNFGLIYGMSAFGLARQLSISQPEAQTYIQTYFQRFPRVQEFMEQTRESARQQGYVKTLWGRRLYLPNIHAGNAALRQASERAAINAPMQGTAADIIKRAMIEVHSWLRTSGSQARMLLQVHDELVLEVPEGELDQVSQNLCTLMVQAADLSVPLEVDLGIGSDWNSAKA
ncbi:MAG: DNA polymerase I [Gammaproteobacteria bacterium]